MTPDLLRQFGEALFGERWQTPLARDLGVAERTMRYWVAGKFAIPEGAQDDLRRLVRERIAELRRLAA